MALARASLRFSETLTKRQSYLRMSHMFRISEMLVMTITDKLIKSEVQWEYTARGYCCLTTAAQPECLPDIFDAPSYP